MTTPRVIARLAAIRGFAWSDEASPTTEGDCPVLAPNGAELGRLDVSGLSEPGADADDADGFSLFDAIVPLSDEERTSLFEQLEDTEIAALAAIISAPDFSLETTLQRTLELEDKELDRWKGESTRALLLVKRHRRVELLAEFRRQFKDNADLRLPATAATAISRARTVHDRLFRDNVRLAAFIAKVHRAHLSFDSALLAACRGLIVALDRFEPTRGLKFTTYGSWWIRHHVGRERQNRGEALRVPVQVSERLFAFVRRERERWSESRRRPTVEEVIATIESGKRPSARHLDHLRSVARAHPASGPSAFPAVAEDILDATVLPLFEGGEIASWIGPALEELEGALSNLQTKGSGKKAEVLRHRLALRGGAARTLRAIGEDYGLSRERIRQLEENALEELKLVGLSDDARPWDWRSNIERNR